MKYQLLQKINKDKILKENEKEKNVVFDFNLGEKYKRIFANRK